MAHATTAHRPSRQVGSPSQPPACGHSAIAAQCSPIHQRPPAKLVSSGVAEVTSGVQIITTDVFSQVLLAHIEEQCPGRHRSKAALWCCALRHRNLQARCREVKRTMRQRSERKSRACLHAALQPVELGPGEVTKELLYTARVQCNIDRNFLLSCPLRKLAWWPAVQQVKVIQWHITIYAHAPALPRLCGGAAPAASAVPSAPPKTHKTNFKGVRGCSQSSKSRAPRWFDQAWSKDHTKSCRGSRDRAHRNSRKWFT